MIDEGLLKELQEGIKYDRKKSDGGRKRPVKQADAQMCLTIQPGGTSFAQAAGDFSVPTTMLVDTSAAPTPAYDADGRHVQVAFFARTIVPLHLLGFTCQISRGQKRSDYSTSSCRTARLAGLISMLSRIRGSSGVGAGTMRRVFTATAHCAMEEIYSMSWRTLRTEIRAFRDQATEGGAGGSDGEQSSSSDDADSSSASSESDRGEEDEIVSTVSAAVDNGSAQVNRSMGDYLLEAARQCQLQPGDVIRAPRFAQMCANEGLTAANTNIYLTPCVGEQVQNTVPKAPVFAGSASLYVVVAKVGDSVETVECDTRIGMYRIPPVAALAKCVVCKVCARDFAAAGIGKLPAAAENYIMLDCAKNQALMKQIAGKRAHVGVCVDRLCKISCGMPGLPGSVSDSLAAPYTAVGNMKASSRMSLAMMRSVTQYCAAHKTAGDKMLPVVVLDEVKGVASAQQCAEIEARLAGRVLTSVKDPGEACAQTTAELAALVGSCMTTVTVHDSTAGKTYSNAESSHVITCRALGLTEVPSAGYSADGSVEQLMALVAEECAHPPPMRCRGTLVEIKTFSCSSPPTINDIAERVKEQVSRGMPLSLAVIAVHRSWVFGACPWPPVIVHVTGAMAEGRQEQMANAATVRADGSFQVGRINSGLRAAAESAIECTTAALGCASSIKRRVVATQHSISANGLRATLRPGVAGTPFPVRTMMSMADEETRSMDPGLALISSSGTEYARCYVAACCSTSPEHHASLTGRTICHPPSADELVRSGTGYVAGMRMHVMAAMRFAAMSITQVVILMRDAFKNQRIDRSTLASIVHPGLPPLGSAFTDASLQSTGQAERVMFWVMANKFLFNESGEYEPAEWIKWSITKKSIKRCRADRSQQITLSKFMERYADEQTGASTLSSVHLKDVRKSYAVGIESMCDPAGKPITAGAVFPFYGFATTDRSAHWCRTARDVVFIGAAVWTVRAKSRSSVPASKFPMMLAKACMLTLVALAKRAMVADPAAVLGREKKHSCSVSPSDVAAYEARRAGEGSAVALMMEEYAVNLRDACKQAADSSRDPEEFYRWAASAASVLAAKQVSVADAFFASASIEALESCREELPDIHGVDAYEVSSSLSAIMRTSGEKDSNAYKQAVRDQLDKAGETSRGVARTALWMNSKSTPLSAIAACIGVNRTRTPNDPMSTAAMRCVPDLPAGEDRFDPVPKSHVWSLPIEEVAEQRAGTSSKKFSAAAAALRVAASRLAEAPSRAADTAAERAFYAAGITLSEACYHAMDCVMKVAGRPDVRCGPPMSTVMEHVTGADSGVGMLTSRSVAEYYQAKNSTCMAYCSAGLKRGDAMLVHQKSGVALVVSGASPTCYQLVARSEESMKLPHAFPIRKNAVPAAEALASKWMSPAWKLMADKEVAAVSTAPVSVSVTTAGAANAAQIRMTSLSLNTQMAPMLTDALLMASALAASNKASGEVAEDHYIALKGAGSFRSQSGCDLANSSGPRKDATATVLMALVSCYNVMNWLHIGLADAADKHFDRYLVRGSDETKYATFFGPAGSRLTINGLHFMCMLSQLSGTKTPEGHDDVLNHDTISKDMDDALHRGVRDKQLAAAYCGTPSTSVILRRQLEARATQKNANWSAEEMAMFCKCVLYQLSNTHTHGPLLFASAVAASGQSRTSEAEKDMISAWLSRSLSDIARSGGWSGAAVAGAANVGYMQLASAGLQVPTIVFDHVVRKFMAPADATAELCAYANASAEQRESMMQGSADPADNYERAMALAEEFGVDRCSAFAVCSPALSLPASHRDAYMRLRLAQLSGDMADDNVVSLIRTIERVTAMPNGVRRAGVTFATREHIAMAARSAHATEVQECWQKERERMQRLDAAGEALAATSGSDSLVAVLNSVAAMSEHQRRRFVSRGVSAPSRVKAAVTAETAADARAAAVAIADDASSTRAQASDDEDDEAEPENAEPSIGDFFAEAGFADAEDFERHIEDATARMRSDPVALRELMGIAERMRQRAREARAQAGAEQEDEAGDFRSRVSDADASTVAAVVMMSLTSHMSGGRVRSVPENRVFGLVTWALSINSTTVACDEQAAKLQRVAQRILSKLSAMLIIAFSMLVALVIGHKYNGGHVNDVIASGRSIPYVMDRFSAAVADLANLGLADEDAETARAHMRSAHPEIAFNASTNRGSVVVWPRISGLLAAFALKLSRSELVNPPGAPVVVTAPADAAGYSPKADAATRCTTGALVGVIESSVSAGVARVATMSMSAHQAGTTDAAGGAMLPRATAGGQALAVYSPTSPPPPGYFAIVYGSACHLVLAEAGTYLPTVSTVLVSSDDSVATALIGAMNADVFNSMDLPFDCPFKLAAASEASPMIERAAVTRVGAAIAVPMGLCLVLSNAKSLPGGSPVTAEICYNLRSLLISVAGAVSAYGASKITVAPINSAVTVSQITAPAIASGQEAALRIGATAGSGAASATVARMAMADSLTGIGLAESMRSTCQSLSVNETGATRRAALSYMHAHAGGSGLSIACGHGDSLAAAAIALHATATSGGTARWFSAEEWRAANTAAIEISRRVSARAENEGVGAASDEYERWRQEMERSTSPLKIIDTDRTSANSFAPVCLKADAGRVLAYHGLARSIDGDVTLSPTEIVALAVAASGTLVAGLEDFDTMVTARQAAYEPRTDSLRAQKARVAGIALTDICCCMMGAGISSGVTRVYKSGMPVHTDPRWRGTEQIMSAFVWMTHYGSFASSGAWDKAAASAAEKVQSAISCTFITLDINPARFWRVLGRQKTDAAQRRILSETVMIGTSRPRDGRYNSAAVATRSDMPRNTKLNDIISAMSPSAGNIEIPRVGTGASAKDRTELYATIPKIAQQARAHTSVATALLIVLMSACDQAPAVTGVISPETAKSAYSRICRASLDEHEIAVENIVGATESFSTALYPVVSACNLRSVPMRIAVAKTKFFSMPSTNAPHDHAEFVRSGAFAYKTLINAARSMQAVDQCETGSVEMRMSMTGMHLFDARTYPTCAERCGWPYMQPSHMVSGTGPRPLGAGVNLVYVPPKLPGGGEQGWVDMPGPPRPDDAQDEFVECSSDDGGDSYATPSATDVSDDDDDEPLDASTALAADDKSIYALARTNATTKSASAIKAILRMRGITYAVGGTRGVAHRTVEMLVRPSIGIRGCAVSGRSSNWVPPRDSPRCTPILRGQVSESSDIVVGIEHCCGIIGVGNRIRCVVILATPNGPPAAVHGVARVVGDEDAELRAVLWQGPTGGGIDAMMMPQAIVMTSMPEVDDDDEEIITGRLCGIPSSQPEFGFSGAAAHVAAACARALSSVNIDGPSAVRWACSSSGRNEVTVDCDTGNVVAPSSDGAYRQILVVNYS